MNSLSSYFATEAMIFQAIECWDYVLYAQEQYELLGNERILAQTLRNQIPQLESLARELPGFAKVIWTPEVRGWHMAFLDKHDGEWLERKSAEVSESQPVR